MRPNKFSYKCIIVIMFDCQFKYLGELFWSWCFWNHFLESLLESFDIIDAL